MVDPAASCLWKTCSVVVGTEMLRSLTGFDALRCLRDLWLIGARAIDAIDFSKNDVHLFDFFILIIRLSRDH
jgi:hypothetical protein